MRVERIFDRLFLFISRYPAGMKSVQKCAILRKWFCCRFCEKNYGNFKTLSRFTRTKKKRWIISAEDFGFCFTFHRLPNFNEDISSEG